MAAVTRVKARPCTPVGYEYVAPPGVAGEDLTAGDLVTLTATGWVKTTAGSVESQGIALKDYYNGQRGIDIGKIGEMDGFSGLTAGAGLYPSGTVAGGLDTTAPTLAATTPAVPAQPHVRALSASRIFYNFV